MANQDVELTIRLNSDTGQLEIVSQRLKKVGNDAEQAGKKVGEAGEGFKSLSKAIGGLVTAAAIGAFFKSAVQGAEEQNQAMRRLKFAVDASGGSFKESQSQINDWAQSIHNATRFTDGQAIETLGKFVRITGDVTSAEKASQLAMSLSAVTGKELSTSIDVLVGLINKNERAVKMARQEFGSFIGGAETGQQVLDILSTKFGDAALKEEGFSATTSKFNNTLDEFKNIVGNGIIPGLTLFVDWMTKGFKYIEEFSLIIASEGAKWVVGFQGVALAIGDIFESIGKASQSLKTLDFSGVTDAIKEGMTKAKAHVKEGKDAIVAIEKEAEAQFNEIENRKTQTHALQVDTHVQQTKAKTEAELAAEKKLADDKAAADQKLLDEKATLDDRLASMEDELNIKMAQLGEDSLEKKRAVMSAEEQAEINKVNRMAIIDEGTEKKKQAAIDKIKAYYDKKDLEAVKLTNKEKAQLALDAAGTAIQALQMLNNASEINSKNDARRAKLLLALQQSITIANIWVANTKLGSWGVAKSIAETGLAVAAFAVQSKAIDKARAANDQEISSTSISQDLGNGTTITDTFGGSSSGSTTSGGVSSLGSSGGSSSGGGGGGGSTIINVGGVVVNFSTDTLDLNNVDMVARRLGEAVKRGTTEAVQMAIALYNSGEKNAGVAR